MSPSCVTVVEVDHVRGRRQAPRVAVVVAFGILRPHV